MAGTETTDYKAVSSGGGFGNRIGWVRRRFASPPLHHKPRPHCLLTTRPGPRPALLLIDVCRAYWTPGSPLDTSGNPASLASLAVLQHLLSTARESKVPVIWTTIRYRPDMSDAGLFHAKSKNLEIWREGSASGLGDWMPDLIPDEGREREHVLVKKHASAFFGTELAGLLVGMGVDTLVIGGVSTSGCVRASTLDALSWNFRPMVVESACGDRSAAIHEANVHDMDAKMADVVSEAEAVEHLGTPWRP